MFVCVQNRSLIIIYKGVNNPKALMNAFLHIMQEFHQAIENSFDVSQRGREETAGAICISWHGNYKCKMAHPLRKE